MGDVFDQAFHAPVGRRGIWPYTLCVYLYDIVTSVYLGLLKTPWAGDRAPRKRRRWWRKKTSDGTGSEFVTRI